MWMICFTSRSVYEFVAIINLKKKIPLKTTLIFLTVQLLRKPPISRRLVERRATVISEV